MLVVKDLSKRTKLSPFNRYLNVLLSALGAFKPFLFLNKHRVVVTVNVDIFVGTIHKFKIEAKLVQL